jgi:hypothetical protein
MAVIENTRQVLGNIVEGVSYGYSDCCIINHSLRQFDGQMFYPSLIKPLWQGSGYICCPHCSSTKNHFQVHVEIAGKRLYGGVFPESGSDSDDVNDELKRQSKRISHLYHYMVSSLEQYVALKYV